MFSVCAVLTEEEEEDKIDEGRKEIDEGRKKRRAKWDIIHYGVMTAEKMTSFTCKSYSDARGRRSGFVCLDLADTYSMGACRLDT